MTTTRPNSLPLVSLTKEKEDSTDFDDDEDEDEKQIRGKWLDIFDNLDKADGKPDGFIERKALVKWVSAMDLQSRIDFEAHLNISPNQVDRILAKVDHNNDGYVDRQEFENLILNKGAILTKRQESVFQQYLQVVAYAEEYRWCPPPWFTLFMTFLQSAIYAYEAISSDYFDPSCSMLIYSPTRRLEVWRFLTYMFVHADIQHIMFNMTMQLLVGLPLEMSHGSIRVIIVYLFGVAAGSLATSVFDAYVYLAGASGGVYSLVAAHLATLVLNWREDRVILQHRLRRSERRTAAKLHGQIVRCLRLAVVLLYAAIDTGVAVYRRSWANISFTAHLSGGMAGLLVGIIVLKNRKVEAWEKKLKAVCVITFIVFSFMCVLWNIIGDRVWIESRGQPFYYPEENFRPTNCTTIM